MSINSAEFLAFLAAALLLYYLVPKRARWLVLLAASAFFYVSYSARAAVYLLATIVLTFFAALVLERLNERGKKRQSEAPREERQLVKKRYQSKRRLLLGSVLTLNFLTLAVFKYFDAWFASFNAFFAAHGTAFQFRPLELLLPLGISFYIFQVSGYLIDVSNSKTPAERNILKYALFVSYFPQMVQGPISRYGQLQKQLVDGNAFSADNIRGGVQLMIWGMLKKVFIADVLAAGVTELYANYASYSGAVVFFGAALYCLQLYADFSGGTDIIRGASEMFGVVLVDNFKRPYFSTSIEDFWRRWHISLGEWMKDYLFYPLALSKWLPKLCKRLRGVVGQRAGKLLVPCVSTVIVFLAVGVWQGPGLSNIAYGLWNGIIMSGAMLLAPAFSKTNERLHINPAGRGMHVFRILRTCFLVVIGRYFSRALSFRSAIGMLHQTFTKFTWHLSVEEFFSFGLTKWNYLTVFIAACVLFYVSVRQERGTDMVKSLAAKPAFVQFLLLLTAILLLLVFVYLNGDYTAIGYIYENV